MSSLLTALTLEVTEEIKAPLDHAAKCINDAFVTVHFVAQIAALEDVSTSKQEEGRGGDEFEDGAWAERLLAAE